MASKSADIRPGITLACTECKERNYITTKNRRNTPDRLELKSSAPAAGKQTVHRETRLSGNPSFRNPTNLVGFLYSGAL